MTLDLHTLHQELNQVHLCRPPRGKHFVGSYLRATQMPEESIISWVQDNYQSYAYRHMNGLIVQTFQNNSLAGSNKKLKDATYMIDNLYNITENFSEKGEKTQTKRSSIFSRSNKDSSTAVNNTEGEGRSGRMANLLSQSFRRASMMNSG